MTKTLLQELCAWSMTDDEWRAAGCPPPGSLLYAMEAAKRKQDAGETYLRLMRELEAEKDKP